MVRPAARANIQVAKPRLPPARAILPYLRQIDTNAWYSNHGPLAQQLQTRLAEHWGMARGEVALLSNATSALTLALIATGAPPGSLCLMPSWTFIASAGAVRAAGLVPHFMDVRPDTWAPDPNEVAALARATRPGAIMVVAPFGAPIDLAAWDAVQASTGVPVVIDAAAAFDTLRVGGPMTPGQCPLVVSLHATKVFGVGEGGALITRDDALMERVRRLAQFGFLGTREATLPGVNAKLSEYAAAVGLAGLDSWPETRARWAIVAHTYLPRLRLGCGVGIAPDFAAGWISSTLNVLWPEDRLPAINGLSGHGVAMLRWWGPGCHAHPAYAGFPAEPLPVTEMLARRCVGLPFWQDLTEAQVDAVCLALARCCNAAANPRPTSAEASAHADMAATMLAGA